MPIVIDLYLIKFIRTALIYFGYLKFSLYKLSPNAATIHSMCKSRIPVALVQAEGEQQRQRSVLGINAHGHFLAGVKQMNLNLALPLSGHHLGQIK